ncbi:hypothetical protein HG531_006895 [Fusarium graminearum]|nr:hypothetical protein HG531_006895 [Fusarium graminearum]
MPILTRLGGRNKLDVHNISRDTPLQQSLKYHGSFVQIANFCSSLETSSQSRLFGIGVGLEQYIKNFDRTSTACLDDSLAVIGRYTGSISNQYISKFQVSVSRCDKKSIRGGLRCNSRLCQAFANLKPARPQKIKDFRRLFGNSQCESLPIRGICKTGQNTNQSNIRNEVVYGMDQSPVDFLRRGSGFHYGFGKGQSIHRVWDFQSLGKRSS